MGTALAVETTASYPVTSYQVVSSYAGSTSTFIVPFAGTQPIASPTSIAIDIPLLYIGTGDSLPSYANADFSFGVSGSAGNYSVQITLLGTGNMWSTVSSNRTQLMQNFTSFLEYIETNYELAATPALAPGSTNYIGQAIACSIPTPLQESIFYRYSFFPGFAFGTVPYVDIRPGMRLRVETQASQLVAAGSNLNGYISGGQSIFRVNSVAPNGGARQVGFDPFLGNINSPAISGSSSAQPVLAGGLVDLQQPSSAGRYVRLFYPNTVPGPTSPGSTSTGSNPTLVTAQSLADMNNVTTKGIGQASIATVFLGRAVAIPEIAVYITTAVGTAQPPFMEYVPVGTTVSNVVERYMPLPLLPGAGPSVTVSRINTAATVFNAPSNNRVLPVKFAAPAAGSTFSSSLFDLPLVAGDVISLTF